MYDALLAMKPNDLLGKPAGFRKLVPHFLHNLDPTVPNGVLHVAVACGVRWYGNAKSIVVQTELADATLHTPYEDDEA